MKRSKFKWLIYQKSLLDLIGAEYAILKESGEKSLLRLYLTGFFLILILGVSFFSVFYAFELMFHMWYMEVFLAMFFSLLFLLLYIFLIHTVSKKGGASTHFFKLSNIARIGFVVLIGFIIAQPVVAFLMSEKLNAATETHKSNIYTSLEKSCKSLFGNELGELEKQNKIIYKRYLLGDQIAIKDYNKGLEKINTLNNKLNNTLAVASIRINNSDYFIYRLRFASNHLWQSWAITVLIVILYLTPVYLVYSISSDDEYNRIKHSYELKLIKSTYDSFKTKYSTLFSEKYGLLGVEYYEVYEDPPFNTRKIKQEYKSQDDFISKIFPS